MGKTDDLDKNSKQAKQPNAQVRPFYFPEYDVSVMSTDMVSAEKELQKRLKTLDEIKAAEADNGEQE